MTFKYIFYDVKEPKARPLIIVGSKLSLDVT